MPLNIVFIDDEQELCDIYQALFSSQDVVVNAFSDCHQALEYINSHSVDLCFIDYRMPSMDGLQCRAKISPSLKCYLITGELDVKLPSHFEGVLSKPFQLEDFQKVIAPYL